MAVGMLNRRAILALSLAAAGYPGLAACTVQNEAEKRGSGHGGSSSGADSGNSSSSAGDGGGGTISTGPQQQLVGAAGVTIRELALYQGVKRPLMENGAVADSDIPVVQGRDALIRVFVDTDESYDGGPVTARLELEGQPPLEIVKSLGSSSSDSSLGSTINFEIPGDAMVPGTGYRVALLQLGEAAGENPAAVFPATGTKSLDVAAAATTLHVKLIPLEYSADGSNRVPSTSDAQIQRYRDLFYGMYPLSKVTISVHDTVSGVGELSPDGNGWESLVQSLADFRNDENAADDVYYYGIFNPASSLNAYCANGCVLGLAFDITGPADVYGRVAIGVGFNGSVAVETAVHEIGHVHGRYHAPSCGAQGTDPNFPSNNGKIGSWGYDIVEKDLFSPTAAYDLMGYCSPYWVSDYTYKALFSRLKFVNSASAVFPPETLNRTYERVRVDANGVATFLEPITLRKPPMAQSKSVVLESGAGAQTVVGQLYTYDHLEGGLVFWPQPAQPSNRATIEIAGRQISAIR